jgi:histidine triad (HIT) family protein
VTTNDHLHLLRHRGRRLARHRRRRVARRDRHCPLRPGRPGHVLVIPKTHVRDFQDDPIVTAATMARAAELGDGQMNLITSAGEAATQTVFHLHVHLVPRTEGDGLTLPWTGQHVAAQA